MLFSPMMDGLFSLGLRFHVSNLVMEEIGRCHGNLMSAAVRRLMVLNRFIWKELTVGEMGIFARFRVIRIEAVIID